MNLRTNKMKSYVLIFLGCLMFAEQITKLTADTTNTTPDEKELNSTTTKPSNVTTHSPSTSMPTSSSTSDTTHTPTKITTTNAPSTTTVNPPDVKDPSKGSWTVYCEESICVKLDAAIQFRITYQQDSKRNVTAKLNVPQNAIAKNNTGMATILLQFEHNNLTITFKNESNEISATSFTLEYFMDEKDFPDAKDKNETVVATAVNMTEFKASTKKSFQCKTETLIHLNDNVVLSMQQVTVQAFMNETKDEFGDAIECSGDEKINDIVPIAVGCALAALVIIVLIAYLVGRQRSRQQGYQSV